MLSRRGLLRAGLGGSAAAVASGVLDAKAAPARADASQSVPFYGQHQAGITTPPPSCLVLAAFDLGTSSAARLRLLLREWTDAAARMTEGNPVGSAGPAAQSPDSGETQGAGAQHLTVTIGFGPQLFDKLGMARQKPAGLQPLPSQRGDRLDPNYSDGDVLVQACADSELVALHAARQLMRLASPLLTARWLQAGFGLAARPPQVGKTPRNLLGFKDGTANPTPNSAALRNAVWIQAPDEPRWARGGSYLAIRRIRTDLARWDSDTLDDQQQAIGRIKGSGAPLTGGAEFTAPDFAAARNGTLVIPQSAHIRHARPHAGEAPMLRRGCGFDDGLTPEGYLDAGALFLAFVRDLQRQFVPVLTRVMSGDELTRGYTAHVGSAVFVVPPGATRDGYVGQTLFG